MKKLLGFYGNQKSWRALVGARAVILLIGSPGAWMRADDPCIPSGAVGDSMVRRSGTHTVLLLGCDRSDVLTDVMMLATGDTVAGTIHVAQIPRDTYAAYTEGSYRKLNGALGYFGSERDLCRFLERAFCLPIDSYIRVDFEAVIKAVDALGGVTVSVPYDMDYEDPAQGLSIHIPRGEITLNGEEALHFIRFRQSYVRGDEGRMDAQKLLLAALYQKVSGQGTRSLASLIPVLYPYVHTDLSLGESLRLVRGITMPGADKVTFLTMPGESVRADVSGAWYYSISREGALEAINRYLNVYTTDIRAEDFDASALFCNEAYESFSSAYRTYIPARPYSVRELEEGSLKIDIQE